MSDGSKVHPIVLLFQTGFTVVGVVLGATLSMAILRPWAFVALSLGETVLLNGSFWRLLSQAVNQ